MERADGDVVRNGELTAFEDFVRVVFLEVGAGAEGGKGRGAEVGMAEVEGVHSGDCGQCGGYSAVWRTQVERLR